MMLPGMRQVQQLLLVRAPGARGEGVQHRLPDVGRAAIDQDNACPAATTQRVPKTGCQDQSGNPATGDQYGASSLPRYPRAILGGNRPEIGRASGRERVGLYVSISVVAVTSQ